MSLKGKVAVVTGAVLVIGGLLARQHHDPASLYWTIAITNLAGAPLAVPLTAVLIRRRARRQALSVSVPVPILCSGISRPVGTGISFRRSFSAFWDRTMWTARTTSSTAGWIRGRCRSARGRTSRTSLTSAPPGTSLRRPAPAPTD